MSRAPLLPLPLLLTGSRPKRLAAWGFIRSFARFAPDRQRRRSLRQFTRPGRGSAASYITAGLGLGSWSRIAAWLRKYRAYLGVVAIDSGRPHPTRRMMWHNGLALEFLALVADERKGRTRVAAAIRALNFIRQLLGIQPLSADPRTALIQEGVLRSFPHKPKGTAPFPPIAVTAIASVWGKSSRWWERQVALAIYVAFIALLRGSGLRCIPRQGVTWVAGGTETTNPRKIPRKHSGAILLVTKRKGRQKSHSWVPLRAGKVTKLLAAHVSWLRSLSPRPRFLFPARQSCFPRGKLSWVPKKSAAMGTTSFLSFVRAALTTVCGLKPEKANRFTVHALRVGGINYYRRLGVPLELRAQMADHMSLPSSLRYLRMNPADQFRTINAIVRGNDGA